MVQEIGRVDFSEDEVPHPLGSEVVADVPDKFCDSAGCSIDARETSLLDGKNGVKK